MIDRSKYLEKIKEFRLIDDTFCARVFDGNIKCTELLVRIILGRDDITVKSVRTQREITNLIGHSTIFDIDAVTGDNKQLDIEMQRDERGASPKRPRYHSALMDANILAKGKDYKELPESYVIFITETDVLGEGLPIYHIDRMITETGKSFGDGSHIIYINGAYDNAETKLGKLIHDLNCRDSKDMYFNELANEVNYYKTDEKEVSKMCKIMEDLAIEAKEDGKVEIAEKMIKKGVLSLDDIADYIDLPLDRIKKIAEDMKLTV